MTLEQAAGGRGAYRYLRELELGKRSPSLSKLLELAKLFGVTVADLVNVAGARPSKVRLLDRKALAPKPGRKPKGTRR